MLDRSPQSCARARAKSKAQACVAEDCPENSKGPWMDAHTSVYRRGTCSQDVWQIFYCNAIAVKLVVMSRLHEAQLENFKPAH